MLFIYNFTFSPISKKQPLPPQRSSHNMQLTMRPSFCVPERESCNSSRDLRSLPEFHESRKCSIERRYNRGELSWWGRRLSEKDVHSQSTTSPCQFPMKGRRRRKEARCHRGSPDDYSWIRDGHSGLVMHNQIDTIATVGSFEESAIIPAWQTNHSNSQQGS